MIYLTQNTYFSRMGCGAYSYMMWNLWLLLLLNYCRWCVCVYWLLPVYGGRD